MKKKLFVWYYKHNGHVCGLDEDGNMIAIIVSEKYNGDNITEVEKLKTDFFLNNSVMLTTYEVINIDQKSLEQHMYEGRERDLLRKDFQHAWDLYKGVAASAN